MSDDLDPRYRLSRTVLPRAYRLRLEPDLDASTFSGTASIDVDVATTVHEVTLNAVDLELLDAGATTADGRRLGARTTLDADTERATLTFDEPLGPGAAVLSIAFRAPLNDHLVGLYRSTYVGEDGRQHTIASTQLASTEARRMFPCFDEPAMKATFELTAVVADGLAAYSNSPVASETTLPDGRRELRFAPTMRMSTYLVALVVGRFSSTEVVDVDGVPLSVVCTPGKERLARLALDAAAFSLRFFSEYFEIPYPGDKVDLVAIPDFAFGAMENLGCVTFRETALLVDPATASTRDLQRVAMVVAHELAHMWFGDLVTMAWWEGIWLNEAFATFMQHACIDAFRPEWQAWVSFAGSRELGLSVDGLHSTRPIEFTVHSPADAMAMFDPITYQKGATVLRMLEQYLTEPVFRDGIRRYLAEHAHANTVTNDLWAALEAASGEPVGSIMDTWVLQGGHPTVHVRGGSISQTPFQFGPAAGGSSIGSEWRVPVRSRPLGGGDARAQLLDAAPAKLVTGLPAVVNAGGSGAYRTSYDDEALAALATGLGALTEIERATLLGDTRALARAGERSARDVLTIAGGLGVGIEPSSWAIVEEQLGFLDRIVDDETRPALERAASRLLGPVLDALGWSARPGEDERAPLVRATAVRVLGTVARDEDVRAEAASRFDAGGVDGELADAVVAVVASMARAGDDATMLQRCEEARDPQAEERYRTGLAEIADAAVCVATFERCFELFRSQDAPRVIAGLVTNPTGGRAVWEALAASWDATLERVPSLLQSALGLGVSSFVSDRAFAERVAAFHVANPLEVGQRRVEQSVEVMLVGVAYAERTRAELASVLG